MKPEAQAFKDEVAFIGKNLEKAQAIVQKLGAAAQANNMDGVLFHATNFLAFSGNLVSAWLLLDNAIEASKCLGSASNQEDKDYYQSKIVDFKFFVQQQLVKNVALSQSILGFSEDLSSLKV